MTTYSIERAELRPNRTVRLIDADQPDSGNPFGWAIVHQRRPGGVRFVDVFVTSRLAADHLLPAYQNGDL